MEPIDLTKISQKWQPVPILKLPEDLNLLALPIHQSVLAIIKTPGQSRLDIPASLLAIVPLIEKIVKFEKTQNAQFIDAYACLLVIKRTVEAHTAQLLDDWHIDLDDGMLHEPSIYILSQSTAGNLGTIYFDGLLGKHSAFDLKFGDEIHTEELFSLFPDSIGRCDREALIKNCQERVIYHLPPYSLHTSPKTVEPAERVFIKLTFMVDNPSTVDEFNEFSLPKGEVISCGQ